MRAITIAFLSVVLLAPPVFADELPETPNTLLLLRYNVDLDGAAGEMPLASNDTTFVTGLVDGAVHVGDNGYIRYDKLGNMDSTEGTVEFWVRPDWDGAQAIEQVFLAVGNSFNDGMLLSIDGAHNLRFIQWGDDPDTPVVEHNVEKGVASSGAGWLAGRWYHLAATWNGSTREMAFYVNGQSVGSIADAVAISDFSTAHIEVGARIDDTSPAEAAIDELRILNRMLPAREILLDYYAGLGIEYQGELRGTCVGSGDRVLVANPARHHFSVFDTDGGHLFDVGSLGAGNGEFDACWDLDVDASDSIFVVDKNNSRVQRFDASGAYLSQFGSAGSARGRLLQPEGIFVDRGTEKIYIADTQNHRVQRFSFDGTLDATWGVTGVVGTTRVVKRDHTGFDRPTAVAVHPLTGHVYVADYGNHRLEIFDSSGGYSSTVLAVYRPNDLAFDGAGNLYIAGEDPNESYRAFDGRIRLLRVGEGLVSKHYTGGIDDIGRIQGGVAIRTDGSIVFSDSLNGRLVQTDPVFTPPISDLDIVAQGSSVTFNWHTSTPSEGHVRYGATNAYGAEVSDPLNTTDHSITVQGLAANTRLYYGVSYADSFDGAMRWTPEDVLNTGIEAGSAQFLRVKAAGLIYLDTDSAAGYAPMTPTQLQIAYDNYEALSRFYWINSGFKLWLDYTVVEMDLDLTACLDVWVQAETDLAAKGFDASADFDAVHGISTVSCGNLGGSGTLFGRHSGFSHCGLAAEDFVAIHEVNHSLDSIFYLNELTKYEFNHGAWAVPGSVGRDLTVNGQIPRNMHSANFTATTSPFTKIMTAPDADTDGLPDSSPGGLTNPLAVTEATFGSSSASTDSDADGVSDRDEAMALPYHGLDPLDPDSDGDGETDDTDPNPAYPINENVLAGSPTIDGVVNQHEGWTVVSHEYGFSNDDLVSDPNDKQADVTTYMAWDDNYLYLGLTGPPSLSTVYLDGSADNWFFGPDNYKLSLRNDSDQLSVAINVGVPDVFRQIDDDGQYSWFYDTDAQFTQPYQGRTIYDNPSDGLSFPGRLVTEQDLVYARANDACNFTWELAIPWSTETLLLGYIGKDLAIELDVDGDRLFESDHAARVTLADLDACQPDPVVTLPSEVACIGELYSFDGSQSTVGIESELEYRWLADCEVVCDWSPSPGCDVIPGGTATYALHVRGRTFTSCVGLSDPVTVVAQPCVPYEVSAVGIGEPPLQVGDHSLTVENQLNTISYNVYTDTLGSWYGPTQATGSSCGITEWTDNGDGTITLDFEVPADAWVVVTGSNAVGTGPAGLNSDDVERTLLGSWEICP